MAKRVIEFIVGIFILLGIIALFIAAFKISNLRTYQGDGGYQVTANFDNIGSLKVRAPVKIAGVTIGQVTSIVLDTHTFKAVVTLKIRPQDENIPVDSSASILTAGLLGDNYINIVPGFDDTALKEGSRIETTNSALILEDLIGQFLFKMQSDKKQE